MGIRDDGMIGDFVSFPPGIAPRTSIDWLEHFYKGYRYQAGEILFKLTNPRLSDEDFARNLQLFCADMMDKRKQWKQSAIHEGYPLLYLNDLFQGEQPTREPTIHDH